MTDNWPTVIDKTEENLGHQSAVLYFYLLYYSVPVSSLLLNMGLVWFLRH